jgi:hypothetical protein
MCVFAFVYLFDELFLHQWIRLIIKIVAFMNKLNHNYHGEKKYLNEQLNHMSWNIGKKACTIMNGPLMDHHHINPKYHLLFLFITFWENWIVQ